MKGKTGKRYTEAEKRKILAFVASQGRGGISSAQKKYGVSYVAMRRWMNGVGVNGAKVPKGSTYSRQSKEFEKFVKQFKLFAAKL